MVKYEYLVDEVTWFDLKYIIKKRGEEGWLLCTMCQREIGGRPVTLSTDTYILTFSKVKTE